MATASLPKTSGNLY